jgi:hypothetical protein
VGVVTVVVVSFVVANVVVVRVVVVGVVVVSGVVVSVVAVVIVVFQSRPDVPENTLESRSRPFFSDIASRTMQAEQNTQRRSGQRLRARRCHQQIRNAAAGVTRWARGSAREGTRRQGRAVPVRSGRPSSEEQAKHPSQD